MKSISLLLLIVTAIYSCSNPDDFEVSAFYPMANFTSENDTVKLKMDLSDAIINGVEIPVKNQCPEGYFKLQFNIKNQSDNPQQYYYRIFYQNESYKHNEFRKSKDSIVYNDAAGNNFYGSWDDTSDYFHLTPEIMNDGSDVTITDSFRITGNPRNEIKYKGSDAQQTLLSDEIIKAKINEIKNSPEWLKQVKEKSIKNNIKLEEQLYKDALWAIKDKSKSGTFNNRWKRNPRTGSYSFLLIVTTKDHISHLPASILNISQSKNGKTQNPYYDLLYNPNLKKQKIQVIKSQMILKTHANFDPGSGIFIDLLEYDNPKIDSSHFSENCGASNEIYKSAEFEQFFHNITRSHSLKNIPVIRDVTGGNYTQAEYNNNISKFKSEELISDLIYITQTPGKTVKSDPKNKKLIMITPGNNHGSFRKENVGVNSRIGFTYGKYIARIRFPSIISKDNVWNGLTCAFWLKFQEDAEWNNRSDCDSAGYLFIGDMYKNSPRIKTTSYSEIDFEILKTSQHWPATSYPDMNEIPRDDPKSNRNIIVTCTNWDLACRSPKNFSIGAKKITVNNNTYTTHRWDDWYKALTIKHEVNHDSIFNKPFYYEIEWLPEKIIWRIGETRERMIEVGYMDNTITTIPDNQMVIVFTQEFHGSSWWPLSPFVQDMIPFPKKEIVAEILEVRVE